MNLKINYIIRRINGTFSYSSIGSDHIFVLRHHVPWLLHNFNDVLLAFTFFRGFFFFSFLLREPSLVGADGLGVYP